MKILKYVPNALSVTRIILAVSLLFLPALSLLFLTLYTIAGITDMIDGRIARKFNVATPFGANLDGIADYIFVGTALYTIVPAVLRYPFYVSPGLIAAVVIMLVVMKGAGMMVGYIRYKQLMMMHTYASKTGAMLAFLTPLVIVSAQHIVNANTLIAMLGLYVFFFLSEEILINLVLPEPIRDISSIRQAWRVRKEKMQRSE